MSKKPFLPFREFADKWIEENVSDGYSNMPNFLREFAALIIRQRHSGGSVGVFLAYISKMMEDYHAQ